MRLSDEDIYIKEFIKKGQISFTGMRDVANQMLADFSKAKLDQLYDELNRGKGILDDTVHLNMYLRSFGKMHKAKLDAAFSISSDCLGNFTEGIELYDWGCGQGTATVCFMDFIRENNIKLSIRKITLIDPSEKATDRAQNILSHYPECQDTEIVTVCKTFEELTEKDLVTSDVPKLHIFSNILDVEFDLVPFIHLFQHSMHGYNYFICVGPYYSNNRRVDEFLTAVSPDRLYARADLGTGEWIKEWTFSYRIFDKEFTSIESLDNIRRRIEESKKSGQYFAGYILDSVREELEKSPYAREAQELLEYLSSFIISSNKKLGTEDEIDSKVAVLNNILTRGLPAFAPIGIEKIFSEKYSVSESPKDSPFMYFHSNGTLSSSQIFSALHIIDPRFKREYYNGDVLESSFERYFIQEVLNKTENEFLMQLLEPQRMLSSIVSIPDRKFTFDQRVDFTMEHPYSQKRKSSAGFIIEIDGQQYHSNIFARMRDGRRDRLSKSNDWETYRLTDSGDSSFIETIKSDEEFGPYLGLLNANFSKEIAGEWRDCLEITLSPFAIARLQKTILEAVISGVLKADAKEWNIVVFERDVPCAAVALDNLKEAYEQLSLMEGVDQNLPDINLDIVSTDEFKNSPLHMGHKILEKPSQKNYDLCVDISMLLRDKIDAYPLQVKAETIYIVRSSHYKYAERTTYSAHSIKYLPFVSKNNRGEYVEIIDRKEPLIFFLQNIFRNRNLLNGQLPILSRCLTYNTTIGLLPTGGGKSLIYQFASLLQPGVTVIVDPLQSLMEDQYKELRKINIDNCTFINSGLVRDEKLKRLRLLEKGAVQLMFLSPERFMMVEFRNFLKTMSMNNHVYFSYGVIDEVHTVSEWGHDFRPSYLHLGENMANFMATFSGGKVPIIGLTATASYDVLADVERELNSSSSKDVNNDAIVRPEDDERKELHYRIVGVKTDFTSCIDPNENLILDQSIGENHKEIVNAVSDSKRLSLQKLLDETPYVLEQFNSSNPSCKIPDFSTKDFYASDLTGLYKNAAILFCPYRSGALGVNDRTYYEGVELGNASWLKLHNPERLKVVSFVGGGGEPSRKAMDDFLHNRANMMVATKAFGMGINKPNVRMVFELCHPSSIEAFVQEAGRAGRDRCNAIAYLLYSPDEYIYLSLDKINDIRAHVISEGFEDPVYLYAYKSRNILKDNFREFLDVISDSGKDVECIIQYVNKSKLWSNVDRDVQMYFHNNSFKGADKEKWILQEMTRNIMNAVPTNLLLVQDKLREITKNDDLQLTINTKKTGIVVKSESDTSKQYGFIFLDNLIATYNFSSFDIQSISGPVLKELASILGELQDHSADWLLQPQEDINVDKVDGIYSAMEQVDQDGSVYVTVSWENQFEQNMNDYYEGLYDAITEIADINEWNDIEPNKKPKRLNVSSIGSLLQQITDLTDDPKWKAYQSYTHVYGPLYKAFYIRRDKDDTDKAIYRMSCVGLIEDVTIDYNAHTYLLKIRKRTDDEYLQYMRDFYGKYFSTEEVENKIQETLEHRGENILDKCLGALTDFVYSYLEKKRLRAINDMCEACEYGLKYGDDELKNYIHLYFNSKYARYGYTVNDTNACLTEDLDKDKSSFELVKKYIEMVYDDMSGTPNDNVKHLYGAVLINLRAFPESETLHLLRIFCQVYQGLDNEDMKNELLDSYVDAFVRMERYKSVLDLIDIFNKELEKVIKPDDIYSDQILKEGKDLVMLCKHSKWFDSFKEKYV